MDWEVSLSGYGWDSKIGGSHAGSIPSENPVLLAGLAPHVYCPALS
jgi:hypothetical protein